MKFHPDIGYSTSDSVSEEVAASRTEKFRNISEAWSVLSKTDKRAKYDTARIKGGHMLSSQCVSHIENAPIEIPTSYNTQRDNFGIALKKAGDSWKGNRDKYKCERWNKLSHKDKLVGQIKSLTLCNYFTATSRHVLRLLFDKKNIYIFCQSSCFSTFNQQLFLILIF